MKQFKNEEELAKAGLRVAKDGKTVEPLEPTPKIPDIGNLKKASTEELWASVAACDKDIREQLRQLKEKEQYITALRWSRGKFLVELKRRCKHGNFTAELRQQRIGTQRASEDMRIAKHYKTPDAAGKVPFEKALKAIRRHQTNPATDNCFATPEWLVSAILEDYGLPGLDVAASDDFHFGERWYTEEQDGLSQDWKKDCHNKPVYCNPPHNMAVLPGWVEKAYREAQRKCEVICLLPFWRYYEWFETVRKYAEVRLPGQQVIGTGFGAMDGKQSGKRGYEHIIAIFRKGQKGFCGEWLG
jgi:hypothetical protein